MGKLRRGWTGTQLGGVRVPAMRRNEGFLCLAGEWFSSLERLSSVVSEKRAIIVTSLPLSERQVLVSVIKNKLC